VEAAADEADESEATVADDGRTIAASDAISSASHAQVVADEAECKANMDGVWKTSQGETLKIIGLKIEWGDGAESRLQKVSKDEYSMYSSGKEYLAKYQDGCLVWGCCEVWTWQRQHKRKKKKQGEQDKQDKHDKQDKKQKKQKKDRKAKTDRTDNKKNEEDKGQEVEDLDQMVRDFEEHNEFHQLVGDFDQMVSDVEEGDKLHQLQVAQVVGDLDQMVSNFEGGNEFHQLLQVTQQQLFVGDQAEVTEAFKSCSTEPMQLRVGDIGTVMTINADGDALLDFHGHEKQRWVSREDFNKLRKKIEDLDAVAVQFVVPKEDHADLDQMVRHFQDDHQWNIPEEEPGWLSCDEASPEDDEVVEMDSFALSVEISRAPIRAAFGSAAPQQVSLEDERAEVEAEAEMFALPVMLPSMPIMAVSGTSSQQVLAFSSPQQFVLQQSLRISPSASSFQAPSTVSDVHQVACREGGSASAVAAPSAQLPPEMQLPSCPLNTEMQLPAPPRSQIQVLGFADHFGASGRPPGIALCVSARWQPGSTDTVLCVAASEQARDEHVSASEICMSQFADTSLRRRI